MTCTITHGSINGHPSISLNSGALEVIVLPEKGADLYALTAHGIDFLWKNPAGLNPPGAPPQPGSGDQAFLWNYEGAWQELFPNCGDASVYNGVTVPFHGEVATLPWSAAIIMDTPDEIAVRFSVTTRQTPFRLERVMRLRAGETRLTLDQTVTNTGTEAAHFVWGHHCVLGEPFLAAGCRLHTPATTLHTPPAVYEDTARLQPGQHGSWPLAALRGGGMTDLRDIPGRENHTHDDVYLTGLTDGWLAVSNPALDLTFSLHWDAAVFRCIVNWQVYGGAEAPPFSPAAYALGIEPWVSPLPLGEAAVKGEAHLLEAGEAFHTTLEARVSSGTWNT